MKERERQVLINNISMLYLHNPEYVAEHHRKGENDTPSCAKLSEFR